jgi:hypothetical protein
LKFSDYEKHIRELEAQADPPEGWGGRCVRFLLCWSVGSAVMALVQTVFGAEFRLADIVWITVAPPIMTLVTDYVEARNGRRWVRILAGAGAVLAVALLAEWLF